MALASVQPAQHTNMMLCARSCTLLVLLFPDACKPKCQILSMYVCVELARTLPFHLCVCCVLQARQLCELLDFVEQERLTLLEKEAALQQELEQVRLPVRLHQTFGLPASLC